MTLDETPFGVFDAAQYQVHGPDFDKDLGTAVLVAGQPAAESSTCLHWILPWTPDC
eukprot:evm.model.NODE_4170_length_6426_cov_20.221910.2